jgi:ribosome-associated toxin RatA of RatAB toxin-antitoxin module
MFLLAIAFTLGAAAATSGPAADPSVAGPDVIVREADGVYTVTARFHVAQGRAVAYAVLTDYERIPAFMPGVKSSIVLERAPGRALVEQEAVSRLMMFSRQVHLVLDIIEGPDTLSFCDRSGHSFTHYEGKWRLSPKDDGTDILYELTAKPSFEVPEFVLKRLLKRDSGRMIEALRREMALRR